MAISRILHKKSAVDGKIPTPNQLEYGEIAINYAKGSEMISIKNSENEIVSFNARGGNDSIDTSNFVTTNTYQNISGYKYFDSVFIKELRGEEIKFGDKLEFYSGNILNLWANDKIMLKTEDESCEITLDEITDKIEISANEVKIYGDNDLNNYISINDLGVNIVPEHSIYMSSGNEILIHPSDDLLIKLETNRKIRIRNEYNEDKITMEAFDGNITCNSLYTANIQFPSNINELKIEDNFIITPNEYSNFQDGDWSKMKTLNDGLFIDAPIIFGNGELVVGGRLDADSPRAQFTCFGDGYFSDTLHLERDLTVTGRYGADNICITLGNVSDKSYIKSNVINGPGIHSLTRPIDVWGDGVILYGNLNSNTQNYFMVTEHRTYSTNPIETSSDINLKNVIDNITLSSEDIANTRAIKFTYKNNNERVYIGTVAQDWEKILPDAVSKTKDGALTLDYNGAAMVSIISLAKKIVEQEDKIEKLENLVKELLNKK